MLPTIRTILYATDLDPRASRVFRYAVSLAQRYDARIVVLHVIAPLSAFAQSLVETCIEHEQAEEIHRRAREKVVEEIRGRLERFCSTELASDPLGRARVAEVRVLDGQASEVILTEAGRITADMIVMGTHQHTVIGEALLGSTAHRVLLKATGPVLLIRLADGKEETAPGV
jgi:nucleotide-binding universal stress UspA family protein